MKQPKVKYWIAITTFFLCFQSTVLFAKNIKQTQALKPPVTIEPFTEQLMKELHLEYLAKTDVGFEKKLVLFHEIPGDPPYSMQQRRVLQSNPEMFIPFNCGLSPENILKSKQIEQPVALWISARGYVPGEKITLRLASKDPEIFREIQFCPRPLIATGTSKDISFKATLEFYAKDSTQYTVEISGVKEDESYEFISQSETEKIQEPLKGPMTFGYAPGVLGVKGGISTAIILFQDGSTYKLHLPWGTEIEEYHRGNK
jgi:hypothetical protein